MIKELLPNVPWLLGWLGLVASLVARFGAKSIVLAFVAPFSVAGFLSLFWKPYFGPGLSVADALLNSADTFGLSAWFASVLFVMTKKIDGGGVRRAAVERISFVVAFSGIALEVYLRTQEPLHYAVRGHFHG